MLISSSSVADSVRGVVSPACTTRLESYAARSLKPSRATTGRGGSATDKCRNGIAGAQPVNARLTSIRDFFHVASMRIGYIGWNDHAAEDVNAWIDGKKEKSAQALRRAAFKMCKAGRDRPPRCGSSTKAPTLPQ